MHTYKYLVEITLPCSECGLMSKEAIYEILNDARAGIPSTEITVTELPGDDCSKYLAGS